MKVHHSLATYHGGAANMNKRCAMWLPTFLQRGIHFFGERTEVIALNNFVLFDRVHLPYHRKARGRSRAGLAACDHNRLRSGGYSHAPIFVASSQIDVKQLVLQTIFLAVLLAVIVNLEPRRK